MCEGLLRCRLCRVLFDAWLRKPPGISRSAAFSRVGLCWRCCAGGFCHGCDCGCNIWMGAIMLLILAVVVVHSETWDRANPTFVLPQYVK